MYVGGIGRKERGIGMNNAIRREITKFKKEKMGSEQIRDNGRKGKKRNVDKDSWKREDI